MKFFKLKTIALLALTFFALSTSAQTYPGSLAGAPTPAYGYTPVIVPTPYLTLAGSTATNLANGWTNTVITTNITTTWNSSTAAFTSTTNTVTNSTVAYATFDARGQRYAPLTFKFNGSGASTANLGVMVAKSVNGIDYDTVNQQFFTFAANGTTTVIGSTNLDMYGYGFGKIIYVTNADASVTFTNLGVYSAIDPRNGK